MYKAKLKSKSEVDSGGYLEIVYDVYVDEELKYPDCRTICFPEQVESKMQECMLGLKERVEAAEQIPDNLEVTI